jgi:MFS family permease
MPELSRTPAVNPPNSTPPIRSLRDLSAQQWKSGIAAWMGWMFDGLDMHLYVLVAAPFVAQLMHSDKSDPLVREKSSWIMAAFMIGWALGGGLFGRLGDLLGRSRALSFTILAYACFTGLSFFAQSWEQLLVLRFLAALGIGGEWAVGASLLSETWPKRWGPWIAAVLQTGVNIGVMLAYLTCTLMADLPKRYVFLVGVIPALFVLWIRRAVPEPEEWHAAKLAQTEIPRVRDLFRGKVLRTTIVTILVCACGLSGWWSFMFWNVQNILSLPEFKTPEWNDASRERLAYMSHFLVIGLSTVGNFFAGWLALRWGYRRAIIAMFVGFFVAFVVSFYKQHSAFHLFLCVPWIGFFSGVFGLFTMYMPPLFPVLLRTTGAGFCYNIGRIASAGAIIYFGIYAKSVDLRESLWYAGFLFVPATAFACLLPEIPVEEPAPPVSAVD